MSAIRRLNLLLALSLLISPQAHAAEQSFKVGGMEVFYGIVPAQNVKDRADKLNDEMHAGRVRKNIRHLVVALFEAENGERISDATIDATVTPLALTPSRKRLEPMRIQDTITYGNFFEFPTSSAPYRIVLDIARPGHPVHGIAFEYRP